MLQNLQANAIMSLRELADALNTRGIRTARGGQWSAMQVKRVLERAPA